MLQRNDEICINVKDKKVQELGNQQPSPKQGKVQRVSRQVP